MLKIFFFFLLWETHTKNLLFTRKVCSRGCPKICKKMHFFAIFVQNCAPREFFFCSGSPMRRTYFQFKTYVVEVVHTHHPPGTPYQTITFLRKHSLQKRDSQEDHAYMGEKSRKKQENVQNFAQFCTNFHKFCTNFAKFCTFLQKIAKNEHFLSIFLFSVTLFQKTQFCTNFYLFKNCYIFFYDFF